MTGHPEDGSLDDLVSAIDEGRAVDWDAAERRDWSAEDRATLRELRVLSEIARVHRDPEAATTAPPSPPAAAQPPSRAAETWGSLRILEPIGQGAFGTVYRALDRLDREVALKLMTPGPSAGPDDRARILREGRLLAKLSHQNVIAVYGADEVDGQLGLWMPFIHGATLHAELSARGPFGAHEATLIGLDLCRALAAVHGAGLLHRDIKAQNVMREAGGRTLLMDLGAGLDVARDGLPHATRLTGTPLYLAPEVLHGDAPTVASDIYSLGVLLYHLVSGEFPVDGATAEDIARQHERHARTRLRDVRADLPDDFVRVVDRATEARPEDRYRSAGELEDALARLLAKPRPGPWPPPPVTLWAIGAAAAVVAVVVFMGRSGAPTIDPQVIVSAADRTPGATTGRPDPARSAYTVEAAFHRVTDGAETRLAPDARLAPGDRLLLSIRASRPVYTYVYNEDDGGEAYLLFPLPGQELSNPLPAGRPHRLPGKQAGHEVTWQITSAGGREHFLVFVSPDRDPRIEATLQNLPAPVRDRPVMASRLSDEVIGTLRGVGGLAIAPSQAVASGPRIYPEARLLGSEPETVSGLWVRRLTLANP